LTFMDLSS